jgi:phosphatidylglycerophosphate synthase
VRQLAASADVVIAARSLGKAKTLATLLAMAVLLLAFDAQTAGPMQSLDIGPALAATGFWLMVLAVVLTLASAWDYLRGALPMLLGR